MSQSTLKSLSQESLERRLFWVDHRRAKIPKKYLPKNTTKDIEKSEIIIGGSKLRQEYYSKLGATNQEIFTNADYLSSYTRVNSQQNYNLPKIIRYLLSEDQNSKNLGVRLLQSIDYNLCAPILICFLFKNSMIYVSTDNQLFIRYNFDIINFEVKYFLDLYWQKCVTSKSNIPGFFFYSDICIKLHKKDPRKYSFIMENQRKNKNRYLKLIEENPYLSNESIPFVNELYSS